LLQAAIACGRRCATSSGREVRKSLASQVDAATGFHSTRRSASDDGWRAAIDGCEFVLHVASPFPLAQPKDAQELIVPAREGALRVLRLANECGVKRVVMTSSIVAIRNSKRATTRNFTEADWSDPAAPGLSPYGQSKTVASSPRGSSRRRIRRRARRRVSGADPGSTAEPRPVDVAIVVQRMLDGKMPGIPRLSFAIVDVRDTADLHLLAMTSPQAAGQRYIAGDRRCGSSRSRKSCATGSAPMPRKCRRNSSPT